MKFILNIILLLSFQIVFAGPAHKKMTRQEYIQKFKDEAIREMHLHGIPASITIAQGILESDNGNSPLAIYARNHFGIKCHGWDGASFIQDDDTYNECFRKYEDDYRSYKDHSEFLTTRSRYAFLFNLKPTDYKGWAFGLKKAGYATNPKYPQLLIRLIEDNALMDLDKMNSVATKTKINKVNTDITIPSVIAESPQEVSVDNSLSYIVVSKNNETYSSLARQYEMAEWQIKKYNDILNGQKIKVGDVIYLQPKKGKSKVAEYHIARAGQSLYQISQQYGIKLKMLKRYNNINSDEYIAPGQKIYLKRI